MPPLNSPKRHILLTFSWYDGGMEGPDKVHPWVHSIAREVSASQAPALHAAVERMAREAGIPKPPIFITDPALLVRYPLNVSHSYNAFAVQSGKPTMVLGHHILQQLTNDRSGYTVTRELEAIIGHEFGHLKHDTGSFGPGKYYRQMPLIGLATGMAALALYKYFYEHPEQQHLLHDSVTNDPMLTEHPTRELRPYIHEALVAGQYLAAGALGLGAGLGTARSMKRFIEFRADRFSAELLKDGTPLASALTKLRTMPEAIRAEMSATMRESMATTKMTREEVRSQNWYKQQFDKFTYPTDAERVARLESMRF